MINLQDWVEKPLVEIKIANAPNKLSQLEYDYMYDLVSFMRNGILELLGKSTNLTTSEENEIFEDLIIKSDLAIFLAQMAREGTNLAQNEQIFTFLQSKSISSYIDIFIDKSLHDKLSLTCLSKTFYYSSFTFCFYTLDSLKTTFKPSSSIDSYIHKIKNDWNIYGLTAYTHLGDVEIYEKEIFFWHTPEFTYIKNVYVTSQELTDYLNNHKYALQLSWEYYPYLAFDNPLLYEEDVCQPCKEKIKWINLYFQCPTCKKIYG